MAAASVTDLDDVLSCPICLEHYDDPRLLQCGHQFCAKCIEGLVHTNKSNEIQITCPTCQLPIVFSTKDETKKIPVNRAAKELQDIIMVKMMRKDVCSTCSAGTTVSFFCFDCHTKVCDSCFSKHEMVKSLAHHKCQPIESVSFCEEHDDVASFFCNDHISLLCGRCTMQKHSSCNVENLEQSYATCKENLECIRSRHQDSSFLERNKKAAEDVKSQIQIKCKDAMICLDDTIQLLGEVSKLLSKKKIETKEHMSKCSKELDEYIFSTSTKLESRNSLYQKAKQLMKDTNVGRVVIGAHKLSPTDDNSEDKLPAMKTIQVSQDIKQYQTSLKQIVNQRTAVLSMQNVAIEFHKAIEHKVTLSSNPSFDMPHMKIQDDDNCLICMDTITNRTNLKCGHGFCKGCIDDWFKHKKQCPQCNQVFGIITGNQPDGKMHVSTLHYQLPGHEKDSSRTIQIDYNFPAGVQSADHPHPGKSYPACHRTAYLPDSTEGREVLRLLKIAFEAKVLFTIGRSVTTGKDGRVTWNDVHHKTKTYGGAAGFGYPDPTYLSRVRSELAAKGIK